MAHPDAQRFATPRSRSEGPWVQALFSLGIFVPCLLAARPALRSEAELDDAQPVTIAGPTPCVGASGARPRLHIDIQACRFELFDACGALIREGPCSTGSDSTLRAADGRLWTFRTPRGARRVHHKATSPVWYKPDWAYIEEGQAVPPAQAESRYVRGMLGRFALDIGSGYLVHGSPWRIGIGTRTTHGCIRMLDEDLEVVYRTLQVGDPVLLE